MLAANPDYPKVLMIGPMPAPGVYVGGITTFFLQVLGSWDLPYRVFTYNTNTVPREYGSVNRLNVTNVRRFFKNLSDLLRISRQERPAIIHLHTSRHLALLKDLCLVTLLKLLRGGKVVGHVHHASYPTLLVGGSKFARALQIKWLTATFDRTILLSESIKRDLADPLGGESRQRFNNKVEVLYNFVPLPELTVSKSQDHSEKVTLFFIGNLGPQKGVYDLLAAVAQLKRERLAQFELVLAGPFDSPAEGERLKSRIRESGLNEAVKITGPVAGGAKDKLFRNADIFVLPSYAEGVPMSMLEAMAYSLPVIASAVGGIPETLVDDEMGFLIQPGDITGLGAALRQLIVSPELRMQMGKRGRGRVEDRHTAGQFWRHLHAIYQGVTALPTMVPAASVKSPC